MDEIKQYKLEIEKEIVDKSLSEFGDGKISREELKEIADFTVEGMKNINNRMELSEFLKTLSGRWTFLESVAILEAGKYKDMVEDEVYSGVLTLAQHGKIDEAIKLSKTMTK